jgi:hypothetical protein
VYKLRTATIGVENDNGKRVALTVPEDAVLEIISEYLADGMVDVLWNDRRISMFAVDIEERGEPVRRGAKYDWESDESSANHCQDDTVNSGHMKNRFLR